MSLQKFQAWAEGVGGIELTPEPGGASVILGPGEWQTRGQLLVWVGVDRMHVLKVPRAHRDGEGWALGSARAEYLALHQLDEVKARQDVTAALDGWLDHLAAEWGIT